MSEPSANNVRVLKRAFDILEAFDESSPALSLQKISERIGLPKTTTFRLLATMIETGYILQRSKQDYCLSHKFMSLASVAQSTFDIRELARPVMEEIRDKTQETVDLSIQSGTARICLDVLESPHRIKSIIRPGEVVPLELAAVGKILLAFGSDDVMDRVLIGASTRPDFDPDRLRHQVREARRIGYAQTRSERVPGASAIAAPLRDHTGFARYALAVTGPSYRFDEHREELCQVLLDGAGRISELLGWTRHRAQTETSGLEAPAARIDEEISEE